MSTKKPGRKPANKATADALLDAHVNFMLDQLHGARLDAWVTEELDAALEQAGRLKLNNVVDARAVKGSIQAFAVDLELGGGIPELVGDIARTLHGAEILKLTTLGDVLSDASFKEMLDKALEMQPLRERLIHEVVSSPQYQAFAANLIYEGVTRYLGAQAVARHVPGAASVMRIGKAMMNRAAPSLEATLEDGLRKQIRASVKATAKASERVLHDNFDEAQLRTALAELWRNLKPLKLSTLLRDVTSLDLEEGFVIGYEFWRELRGKEVYRTLIHAGVDRFFASYGERTLEELLDDIGITRELMLGEARRYAPAAIKELKRKGMLEIFLRRNLARFYHSDAAAAVFSKHLP